MVLTLPISDELAARLTARAERAGVDVPTYAASLLEESTLRRTFEEIARPIAEAVAASGMTEDEIEALIDEEKHAARAERRRRTST